MDAHKLDLDGRWGIPAHREAPFDSMRKMMSTVLRGPTGGGAIYQGRADEVLRRCTHMLRGGDAVALTKRAAVGSWSQQSHGRPGAAVLCAAKRVWPGAPERYDGTILKTIFVLSPFRMMDSGAARGEAAIDRCRKPGYAP
jgi:hypothetical protein